MAKKKIMIVDDDTSLRQELSALLSGESYQVKDFADGAEALAKIEQFHPMVLLLDIKMPKINGIQILDYLHTHQLIDGCKVILITAFYDEEKCKRITQIYGADSYLLKPFEPEQLLSRLEKIGQEN